MTDQNLIHALSMANIDAESVQAEMMLGRRIVDGDSTWVVYVCAANSWAFELPGETEQQRVLEVANAVIDWDIAMAEGLQLDRKQASLVNWAALAMKPCELQTMFKN